MKGSYSTVEIKDLKGVFGSLTAREIEDFLCHLEKGIKRIRENKHSTNPLEKELDDIINDILKTNKCYQLWIQRGNALMWIVATMQTVLNALIIIVDA